MPPIFRRFLALSLIFHVFTVIKGVEQQPQTYNYGQYNQQQHQQSQTQNLNPFQSTINNNFDANSWTQANANLFQQQQQLQQQQQQQQQSAFLQQQSSYPSQIQPQQVYGSSENSYGPSVQALTGYGGQPPSAATVGYLPQPKQQQQNVQTYYPFNSADNTYQQPATQQANIYSVPDQNQQPQQTYAPPQQPQQPEPVIYQPQQPQQIVAPQPQQQNYNSYPQFPEPEPEASSQPTIDNTNLQQYAQYLDILQKQYGIKLPAAGSSAVPTNIHEQQQASAVQNPYAAAVHPQTQSHIQSQIQPGIYPQQNGGEHSWNPWQQSNAQTNNNFNFQQQMNKPVVTTYVPQQPAPQPQQSQIQIQQPQQVYGNEVYQQPQPQQQPYYPGSSGEYASTNTVVEPQQPKPLPPAAPHIIFPSSIPQPQQPRPQMPQPQTHVVVQPDVISYTRPQPQQPKPQQPTVYIQPTYPPLPPSTTRPPPPQIQTRPSLEYEREVVVAVATTAASTIPPPPPPRQPSPSPPSTPSTTSIQALTQQIRRLPAVLYVDSRNPDTKRTETLLRETYGLPLVSFYVDKIDKPKAVERHLHQLTAHKGLPYLFICGTFIGSQQHIDNYHANRQVPQLVEFVCSDEKKRKHKKKTSAAANSAAVVVN